MAQRTPFIEYQGYPIEWMRDVMGIKESSLRWSIHDEYADHLWDGTPDPFVALASGLVTHRRIGVESAVGTGKTFFLALLTFWFLSCWKNSIVVSFAPKADQLKMFMWREISKLWPRFQRIWPSATLTSLTIRMTAHSDVWSAHGYPVGVGTDEVSAVKAQGWHEQDMLFLFEETPGQNYAVVDAILNTAVAPNNKIVAVGNPDHQLDALHQFVVKVKGCLPIRISALDHPNIVKKDPTIIMGACTEEGIEDKRYRYGEDSPMERSRNRGFSPAEASNALIKLSWLYQARDRGRELLAQMFPKNPKATLADLWTLPLGTKLPKQFASFDGERAMGVDAADSPEGDRGAKVRGRGAIMCWAEDFPCPDSNVLGYEVAVEARELKIQQSYIGVDGVGVGSGTVNELKAQGFVIQNLKGGNKMRLFLKQFKDETFDMLRSQMYWLFRLDAQYGRLILPDDEDLFIDLTTPTWEPKAKAVAVEQKLKIRNRLPGGRSPNKGDAAIYWNWVRQIRSGSSGGGSMVDF